MRDAPWRNPRVLSTLVCVMLCGFVAGAAVMRFGISPERHVGGAYWKEGAREISLQKFKKELDLTPDQAKQMESVLDDFMMYYQSLQAQMDDVRAIGKTRIMKILRDDQKAKFEKMVEIHQKQLR